VLKVGAQVDQPFRSSTTTIVVDVVVRDQKGQPVVGLKADDFQVSEDGVPQRVATVVHAEATNSRGSVPLPTTSAPSTTDHKSPLAPPAQDQINRFVESGTQLTALVFDRLSPEARAAACKAALTFIESTGPDRQFAVFISDLSLEVVQSFTADRDALCRAIRRVATRATSSFDKSSFLNTSQPSAHPSVSDTAGAEDAGRPVDTRGRTYDQVTLDAVRAGELWERLGRDRQGYASTSALQAIAGALSGAPGRKALVYFAEGLAIPDAVLPRFQEAVAVANRSHVSIYSIDAGGLRVHSGQAETRREVGAIGAAGLVINQDGSSGSNTRLLERNEDVLRKDPDSSLRLLAERTGGVLLNNTNDLGRIAEIVNTDFREHYLVAYEPKNEDFRGEWRRIEVRIPGRRVTVRARAGYLAVRTPAGTGPILAHEARAQAALDLPTSPTDVPIQVAVLSFPQSAALSRVALLISTTLASVATTSSDRYDAEFTILARIRDASGTVVRTASEPYRVSGPLAGAALPTGNVLFFRHPELPAGAYTVEVAIAQTTGDKAGVTRVPFDVPSAAESGLAVSSLTIVDSTEATEASADPANPVITGGRLLYPMLSGQSPSGTSASIGLFLRIMARPSASELTARLQMLRDGVPLAEVPMTLPAPDPSGRVDYQGRVPVGALPSGPYELRVTVSDGSATVQRRATFRKPR
jgi:VWFA-related protein